MKITAAKLIICSPDRNFVTLHGTPDNTEPAPIDYIR
jgi:hypothetical protein